jgi:hypothetical protein
LLNSRFPRRRAGRGGTAVKIKVAFLRVQGINVAVFNADARSHSAAGRDRLLPELVDAATAQGLRFDKAALAFVEGGKLTFRGTADLVRYLARNPGVLRWTHIINV